MRYEIDVVKLERIYRDDYPASVCEILNTSFDKVYNIGLLNDNYNSWQEILTNGDRKSQLELLFYLLVDIKENIEYYRKFEKSDELWCCEGLIAFIKGIYDVLSKDKDAVVKFKVNI